MALEAHPCDGELLRGMVAGDEHAFVTLYRRWQGPLYRFALQMTGNSSAAEEITQEVFLTLVRQPGTFDPSRGALQAFLFGVCRNHILRHITEESRYVGLAPVSFEEGNGSSEPASASDLLADLAEAETVERVRRAVLTLPPHHREAVVLCDLHEMSYDQAAVVIGCPVGTVRSRLHRARELLLFKLKRGAAVRRIARTVPHTKAKDTHELSNVQDDCA